MIICTKSLTEPLAWRERLAVILVIIVRIRPGTPPPCSPHFIPAATFGKYIQLPLEGFHSISGQNIGQGTHIDFGEEGTPETWPPCALTATAMTESIQPHGMFREPWLVW